MARSRATQAHPSAWPLGATRAIRDVASGALKRLSQSHGPACEQVRQQGRVGIPRAFYYFSHPALWQVFFEELGIEPVVSRRSARRTLDLASRVSEAEHCLPNKLFDAHLVTLRDRAEVVFVPRVLSTVKGHIACPKLAALPDAAASQMAVDRTVLSVAIDETHEPLAKTLYLLGRRLGFSRQRAGKAARRAKSAMDGALLWEAGASGPARGKSILLIGHPYILHDPFLSAPIVRTLERLDQRIELISFAETKTATNFIKWGTCSKTYKKLTDLSRANCAGVIQISSFNCGCDSMTSEFFRRVLQKRGIPYMALILDEHSAFVGVETRLEAFTESMEW